MPSLSIHEDFLKYNKFDKNFIKAVLDGKYDVNERDKDGNTILHLIAQSQNFVSEEFEPFLKACANPSLKNNANQTMVDVFLQHYRFDSENLACYRLLQKYHPDAVLFVPLLNQIYCEPFSLIDETRLTIADLKIIEKWFQTQFDKYSERMDDLDMLRETSMEMYDRKEEENCGRLMKETLLEYNKAHEKLNIIKDQICFLQNHPNLPERLMDLVKLPEERRVILLRAMQHEVDFSKLIFEMYTDTDKQLSRHINKNELKLFKDFVDDYQAANKNMQRFNASFPSLNADEKRYVDGIYEGLLRAYKNISCENREADTNSKAATVNKAKNYQNSTAMNLIFFDGAGNRLPIKNTISPPQVAKTSSGPGH